MVKLQSETQSQSPSQNRARMARLPASVHAVHDEGRELVLSLLKDFFERADDLLFELADKAPSNQEQNIFFNSMRKVRVQRRTIEMGFAGAIENAFAALTSHGQQHAVDEPSGSRSANALSLENEEPEEIVALDSSVARANNAFAGLVQQICQRLDSLVSVKVHQKNNPLGPDVICAAFMIQVRHLDIDIKTKLRLFKVFDEVVLSQLGELYRVINQILVDYNVLTSLQGSPQPQLEPNAVEQSAPEQFVHEQLFSAQEGDDFARYYRSGAGSTDTELAAILQQVLGDEALMDSTVEADGAAMPASEQTAHAQLLGLLSLAQRLPAVQEQSATAIDVHDLLSILPPQEDFWADIEHLDTEVIKLVNKLFECMLDDNSLAAPMKALIGRLQIPVLKVALADRSFFTKAGHPVRRLLNEMSTASLGWQGEGEGGEGDPLYDKMHGIVGRLLAEFDTDIGIFSDLLLDLTSFLEKEKRHVDVFVRRTLDAEDGSARAEMARTRANEEVALRTKGAVLPPVVETFINEMWSNVLFIAGLKFGYDSDEWEHRLTTLEQLIWSVQPLTNADDRQRLSSFIPVLLQELRVGLDTISYNPFEMSKLFESLQMAHLANMGGTSVTPKVMPDSQVDSHEFSTDAPVEAVVTAIVSATDTEDDVIEGKVTDNITAGDIVTEDIVTENIAAENIELPAEDPHMRQVESFSQGSWFEMHGDSDTPARCRLAAFIQPTGKYIFVNRSGMKVAEKTRNELAGLLKLGSLRPLDNSILFDRALETVITGLRKGKG